MLTQKCVATRPQWDISSGVDQDYSTQCWSVLWLLMLWLFNTLRPRQNGRLFTDDTFKRIFLNENIWISIKISLKFIPKGLINNIPALVLIMAWRRPGDKPLSEPMLVKSLTHICVTRPQWVNSLWPSDVLWLRRSGTVLDQIIACHLFSAKPLPEPFTDWVNSLWPSDAIWRQGSRSTLVPAMACCLTAPSHYLNQCWLIITRVQWCSSEGNFTWDITAISH